MQDLINRISYEIHRNPDNYTAYDDLFTVCVEAEKNDFALVDWELARVLYY
mgnify:CR=1 FL=1